jgi:tetratricopeptide (TPR) repeat protein
MIAGDFRVFVSAVTSEFGRARSAVGSDLRSRRLSVKVQEDFRQEADADTLLRKLHNYIRECSAVVCIIGDRSGASPTPAEAEPFIGFLPPGTTQASYTQWEFFFASHYRRRVCLYVAKAFKPEQPASNTDDPNLQRMYLQHIEGLGLDREEFSTSDELGRKVLRQDWANSKQPKPIVLPYPSIGDLFKGRGEFLQKLRENLKRGGHAAIVSQALYGLGGIGKTRAAVEYAWGHLDEYSALLFVIAETPEALRRNLAALASILVPKLNTTDDAARLQAVIDWLQVNPGWFLILDNVDGKPALADVERLLGALSGGHVVVTSRLSNFSGNFRSLELGVLNIDDAIAFLLARTQGRRRKASDDDAKVREVATAVNGLALALEQASALIAKRRLTFDQYLEQWRSRRDEVLAWCDATVMGYPRAVAVTWRTSVAELSEGGRHLLERLAWLAPEKVPEFLLDVPIPGIDAENLHDALDDLATYSLVTRDAEGPFFLVHRLVQDVSRRSLADETRHQRLVEALGWIDAAFTGNPEDVRNWPRLLPLASHALAVTAYPDAADIFETAARLMNQLGSLLRAKALFDEAEPLMRGALASGENLGSDHPQFTTYLNNLALLLADTNRIVEAEPLLRRALAMDEKNFGQDHPEVATDLSNLAELLRATNRLPEAELLMRRALAIAEKSYDPYHPTVATRLSNLAGLLQDTNRAAESEPLIRRALAIDEEGYGPDHPKIAAHLINLAAALHDCDRHAEAEPLLRRALAIDENEFGPDHPTVAVILNNLAQLLQSTQRSPEAELLMRRALAIDEKSFGPKHPSVAIRLLNLARLLQDTNRLAEAEPLMRRQAEVFVEFTHRTGHPHPHLEAAFRSYAELLAEIGKSPAEIEAQITALIRPDPS